MLGFNSSAFDQIDVAVFFYALRFDLSAIFYINILFITLHIIPFNWRDNLIYQGVLKFLFHLSNSLAILFNCIDIEYIKYTGKRSTSDIFSLVSISDDLKTLIPQFLKDFWYIIILAGLLIAISEYLYRKTQKKYPSQNSTIMQYAYQSGCGIIVIGISIIFMRGGTQLKPLRINSAGFYTSTKNITLILNTPFTIVKTLWAEYLPEHHFFDEKKLKEQYNPVKEYKPYRTDTTKLNVVLIIMESFSKEHIGRLSGKPSSTPFLDSLINQGLICTNAYANGKKSIEGIPSIISATPSLMSTPYITSPYTGNEISSLPALLKKMGYLTSFYHGGTNGTMGFDAYCKLAGFDSYYGKSEYPNIGDDDDGNWGIFDEPYFQYFSDELSRSAQPFFSCIFSLSSHHPYTIPEKHKSKFGNGKQSLPISMQYADFALKQFFEKAKKTTWFKNTLFVITADHTGVSEDQFYNNNIGMYQIPILFYKADGSLKGEYNKTTQQIDILPSIMHYVNYTKPFFAFGQSIFDDKTYGFAINFLNDEYQYITDDYVLKCTPDNVLSLFEYKSDSLLKNNQAENRKLIADSLFFPIRSIIQTYNYSLINNKQTVE